MCMKQERKMLERLEIWLENEMRTKVKSNQSSFI